MPFSPKLERNCPTMRKPSPFRRWPLQSASLGSRVRTNYLPIFMKLTREFHLNFRGILPLCSPLRTSQMWMVESSDPAKRARPEGETAHEVSPELVVGGRNTNTCWSERRSNRRAVLSSDAETKPVPEGKNCIQFKFWNKSNVAHFFCKCRTYVDGIDVWFVSEESLLALEGAQVPKFGRAIHRSGHHNVLVGQQRHGTHVTGVSHRRVDFLAGLCDR